MKVNATGNLINFIQWYNVWKDCKIFYCGDDTQPVLVDDPSGIPCYYWKDVEDINQDSSDSKVIMIDCLTEGIHSLAWFKKYRKDRHYIIVSNGTWNKDFYDLGIQYTHLYFPYTLAECTDLFNTPYRLGYYVPRNYIFDYPKPCSFVSTIGNVRPLRTSLVDKLKERLSIQNYILRYSGEDLGLPSSHLDVIKFVKGEFDPYSLILEKYYHSVSNTIPIDLYNKSYFNLIVETDLDWPESFLLSEKTIKSFVVGQPFVVMASPGHLANIKKIGFRTFDECWNEEYDSIQEFDKRRDSLVELCEYLSTKFDWQANKEKLQEITRHNYYVFQNIDKHVDESFSEIENLLRKF